MRESKKLPHFFAKKYKVIRKNGEFQYIYKSASSFYTQLFVCYFRENRRRFNRLGIVTSKKIGNAVKRNRARRIIREAYRLYEPVLIQKLNNISKNNSDKPPRFDIIFIARQETVKSKSTNVYNLFEKLLFNSLTSDKNSKKFKPYNNKKNNKNQ